MKKLIVLGAVALFGLSNAQIAQGSTYVSGTLNYQGLRDNNEETKVDDYKFVPTVGYFVADNFAIGVGVGMAEDNDGTAAREGQQRPIVYGLVAYEVNDDGPHMRCSV